MVLAGKIEAAMTRAPTVEEIGRAGPAAPRQLTHARLWGLSAGFWFTAPALTVITLFFLLPIVASLVLSLTDFDIYALADWRNLRFVGVDNYADLLETRRFWVSLGNTLYFVAIGGPLSVVASLGAALLLESKLTRFRTLWRTIFFAPVVTTLVASAVVWRYVYHTKYGLMNYGLGWLGVEPIDWMGDARWSMPAIIVLAVWKNFGYNMVIFMAGLASIPSELYEAAEVDGAGAVARFRHVTVPMLAPTFLFVGVTTMIGFFQFFAEPYVMTRGGPEDSTYSMVMLMYEEGFRWWRLGVASSMAFVLFVITLVATILQMRLQRRLAT
jgi:multiple sugar transport system permease protein